MCFFRKTNQATQDSASVHIADGGQTTRCTKINGKLFAIIKKTSIENQLLKNLFAQKKMAIKFYEKEWHIGWQNC